MGFLVVAGWYLVENAIRYGDPLAMKMQALIVPADQINPKSLFSPVIFVVLPRLLFDSYLGVFGWMSVYLPPVFYDTYAIVWLIAAAGIWTAIVSKRWSPGRRILLVGPLVIYALLLYQNTLIDTNQGRFFFPSSFQYRCFL